MANKKIQVVSLLNSFLTIQNELRNKMLDEWRKSGDDECEEIKMLILCSEDCDKEKNSAVRIKDYFEEVVPR